MSGESENLYRQEIIQKYKAAIEKTFRYIPWFEQKLGQQTSHIYDEDGISASSITFSVYDATLMSFVKEMRDSGLINRNYVYVYSRNFIHTVKDELDFIEKTELKNIQDIFDIMAKYILGGMTKGNMWTQAVENGVFLSALKKLKKLLEVYDHPLA